MILSQDKGRAIVLEDPETYDRKILEALEPPNLLSESEKKYIKLDNDPIPKVKNAITKKIETTLR